MRTLLLADDSITVQRVITLTFADEQIRVVACGNGQQAIERMAAQRPDIVLAGTSLPQVSGYDLARFMRGNPDLKDVPVLLLSGAFETVDDARLAASGANGVIEKPVEPNNVIGRVKELLGLNLGSRPATAGRLITASPAAVATQPPVTMVPRAVTAPRETPSKPAPMHGQAGPEAHDPPVQEASTRPDDYLDTLDAAFDTLDQQLSGRVASASSTRNPSGPLGQSSGAPDPRSPGRRPHSVAATPGNPVFEVDDDWFGGDDGQARADARAGRREIENDLRAPELQAAAAEAPANAVFEVDDDWFAEGNKARAAKAMEQRALAAEMGINDVELPQAEPRPNAPAAVSDSDLDFGIDDFHRVQETAPAPVPAPVIVVAAAAVEAPAVAVADPELAFAPEPVEPPAAPMTEAAAVVEVAAVVPPPPVADLPAVIEPVVQAAALAEDDLWPPVAAAPIAAWSQAPEPPPMTPRPVMPTSPIISLPAPAPAAPASSAPSRDVADDFAQLLAFEQGEHPEPPMPAAPEVRVVSPEITDEMLDQIASRVADRLNAGLFGEQLKSAMTASVRDTVREVVSETSERLVRDEIDRIKSKSRT